DSIASLESALEARIGVYGPKHLEVASAMVALGDALLEQGEHERARQLLDDGLAMQRELAGEQAIETAPTLLSRAKLAQRRGQLNEAERLYAESLGIYRLHELDRTSAAASVVNELANLHSYRGNFAEAGRLYRTALDIDRDALGRDHPQVAMHLHNLAVMMHLDRKSTRLNSSHVKISYAVFCLKKKKQS